MSYQQTLTNMEPSEEDLYQMALRVPLEEKIEIAIALIQTFEKQALALHEEGYYVCFSGGKDSIVLAKLFEMSGVKYTLNYSNVTIDPPELVLFIKREYPQAVWHNPKKNLPMAMADMGMPPTRLARWCCKEYKEQGGNGKFKSIGVRAEESANRKGRWQSVSYHRETGNPILCPIIHWTEKDIWRFIHNNNMPYCSLYDEGFKRLGCVGCPMARKGRVKQFERWPKYEAMWRRGFDAMWAKYKGVPKRNGEPRSIEKYQTVQEFWDWWMSDEAINDTDQPDCQMYLW